MKKKAKVIGSIALGVTAAAFASCDKCKDSKSDFPAEKQENGKVWVMTDWNEKNCQPVYEVKPEPIDPFAELKADSVKRLNAFRVSIKNARDDLIPAAQPVFDQMFVEGRDNSNSGNPQVDSIGGAKNVYGVFKANGGTTAKIDIMNESAISFEDIVNDLIAARKQK